MKKKLGNKIQMFWAVMEILLLYKTLWEIIPVFKEIYDELNLFLKDIDETAIVAGVTTKGVTKGKHSVKDELVLDVFKVGSALFTCSVRSKKPELKNKVSFSESDLKNLSQPNLVRKSKEVAALARENLTEITKSGIKATDIDSLDLLIDQYAKIIPAPVVTKAERKMANEKLDGLFVTTNTLLNEQADKLMEQFRKTNPDFYSEYWNARNTVEYGIRHEKKEAPKQKEENPVQA